MSTDSPKILPSNFTLHVFSTDVADKTILYQILKMKDSLMIFINYKCAMSFKDLSLAMNSMYAKTPISTILVGNFVDEESSTIAIKVAKKTNKTVYVSCNVEGDKMSFPIIERQLFKEIHDHPDKF